MIRSEGETEVVVVDGPAQARAALADPRLPVPEPVGGAPAGTLAWLRASVSRFANGPEHAARRPLVEREIERLQPAALRAAARARAGALLRAATVPSGRAGAEEWPARPAELSRTVPSGRAAAKWPAPRVDVMALLARRVPVGVLCDALAVPGADAVEAVIAIAAAYHPGAGRERVVRADAAVARLVGAIDAEPAVTACRIGVLVQACDATAGLIGNALVAALAEPADPSGSGAVEDLLEDTLRRDPPIRRTRRRAAARVTVDGRDWPPGCDVIIDLAAAGLPFGHGPRACPGRDAALALAAGVVEAVLPGYRLAHPGTRHEPSPNARIPARLEVIAT